MSDVDIFDEGHRPLTYGVAIGGMGGGIFGFEADIAFTPDFFGNSDDEFLGQRFEVGVVEADSGVGLQPHGSPTQTSIGPVHLVDDSVRHRHHGCVPGSHDVVALVKAPTRPCETP